MAKKRGKQRHGQKHKQHQHGPPKNMNDHRREENHNSQEALAGDEVLVINNAQIGHVSSLAAPVGLANLGNTCFFNSVMQNLVQTPFFHQTLKEECHLADNTLLTVDPMDGHTPPLTYIPPVLGPLTTSLTKFFESIKSLQYAVGDVATSRRAARSKIFAPRDLFNQICTINRRFRGYQQQDSQELYSCLLDGVKSEEIKRKKKGILKALNLNKPNIGEVPDEVRQKVKAYGHVVTNLEDTLVEKVFGGTLSSSVLCDGCGTVTVVTESFHELSLPIVEEKCPTASNRKNAKLIKHKSESESEEVAAKVTENNKPPSKHALKKNQKLAKQQKRQNHRKAQADAKRAEANRAEADANETAKTDGSEVNEVEDTFETMQAGESSVTNKSVENLALDMENLSLNDVNEEEQKADSDYCEATGQLKGGALSAEELNLPDQVEKSYHTLDNEIQNPEKQEDSFNDSLSAVDKSPSVLPKNESDSDDLDLNISQLFDQSDVECNGVKEKSDHESSSNKESDDNNVSSLFAAPERPQTSKYSLKESCNDMPGSLGSREHLSLTSRVCSLESCFYQFTIPEILSGSNKFGCETCTDLQKKSGDGKDTVYCNASKQILIQVPPAVLTLHLKRFQQVGCSLRKVNKHVSIPLTFDASPFCSKQSRKYADDDTRIIYALYGMVEHVGSLSRGHYTAYVRTREKDADPSSGVWYHISDSSVSKITQAKALKCNAYLLFYERFKLSSPS